MSADTQMSTMTPEEMDRLIEEHIAAEMAGDTAGAVAMYSDGVVHDMVGAPSGPLVGPEAAKAFYDHLATKLTTHEMQVTKTRHGADFCVVEHLATVTVDGAFMGIPGEGKRVSFRMLHVWDFAGGRISGEQIWLDGGAIAAQLAA